MLSEAAIRIREDLPGDHATGRQISALRRRLDLTSDEVEDAIQELVNCGQVVRKHKTLHRRPVTLSPEALRILEAFPAHGVGVTYPNAAVRRSAGLGKEEYWGPRQELIEAGILRRGKGKGGTVELLRELDTTLAGLVTSESQLYAPIKEALQEQVEDETDAAGEILFGQVFRADRGVSTLARDGGQWTRPDLLCVRVFGYEMLPGRVVELSAYEVKRWGNSGDLENVYQAHACSRFADRCYLVNEVPQGKETPPEIQESAKRLGVGLLEFDSQVGELRTVQSAALNTPQLASKNEYLRGLLTSKSHARLRAEYLNVVRQVGMADT